MKFFSQQIVRRIRAVRPVLAPIAGATIVLACVGVAPQAHADGINSAACSWVGQVGAIIASGDASISAGPGSPPVTAAGETWSSTATCPSSSASGYVARTDTTVYKWSGGGFVFCKTRTITATGPTSSLATTNCNDNTWLNRVIVAHTFWVFGTPYSGGSHILDV